MKVSKWKVSLYLLIRRLQMLFWFAIMMALQIGTWLIIRHHYLKVGSEKLVWVVTIVSFTLSFLSFKAAYKKLELIAEDSRGKWKDSYHQIAAVTKSLCLRAGKPEPRIGLWEGAWFEGRVRHFSRKACGKKGSALKNWRSTMSRLMLLNAGMVDVPFAGDTMLVGEKLPDILTEAELEGVIAHELSHSNQWENKLSLISAFIGYASFLLFLVGGLHYVFISGFSWLWMNPLTFGLLVLKGLLMRAPSAALSRVCEYETDAEASLIIEDPEALIKALEKINVEMNKVAGAERAKTPAILRSHPTDKQRARALRALV